ncbi:WD40 repeat domain-containing protein [Nocardia sp. NPDC056100]|uniref:WD40 repeat domain-containing protein n=1 Tax=Nocardia sp. NPDC056100 TaxID=3345712 RepID=UPI0035DE1C73
MVTGDTDSDPQVRSPRTHFAQRFAELYEAAGNPTLRRVAAAAEQRMRAAQGTRPGGASAQRISDWKAGRNVPARFESLLPVVLTLIDLARKTGQPLTRELAEPKEWQRLWHSATTWNPEADTESACPYPGLISYASADHNLFFGRTRATTELTDLIRTTTGPITLIGASGAGKSSLLAAGIIPALTDWETTALTPGTHPLTALAEALTESTQADSAPAQLDSALAPRTDGPRRLLIIDQFEELFTTCATEREREDFLTTLHTAATRTDDPIAVVLALRADFYAHCLNYQLLQQSLEERSYLLGPMRPDELAQAISAPARAVGLELEPGLEELVITELCGAGDHHGRPTYDPGALPLLSHVMAATWQQREGRRLTTNGYRRAGGVVGSVTETAEHAWNELTQQQQTAAKNILLGLVVVSQDSRDTRRTAQRPELLRRAGDPEDATAVLELLSRTRLISLDADAVTLTHEIVLTAWPRLRAWIDEDRVGYLVRQRVELDAAEWAAQERDSSLLYRGTRLRNALDHVNPPPVGPLAEEFLTAASTARIRTRRRSSRTKAILAVLGAALLVLGFAAYAQTRLVDQQRENKTFTAVLAEADRMRGSDPSLAAQLYLVARQLRPHDEEVRTRLLRTQDMPLVTTSPGHPDGIWQLHYRPGNVLTTLSWDNTVRRWDVTDPRHPVALGQPLADVDFIATSPDGALLATSDQDRRILIWDMRDPATPRQLSVLPPPGKNVMDMRFAGSDGRTLVLVANDRLTFWNLRNPVAPISGPAHELHSPTTVLSTPHIAVSPDGRMLAVGRDTDGNAFTAAIELLSLGDDMTTRVIVDRLAPGEISIGDPVFSPDGRTLAVATYGGTSTSLNSKGFIQFWNITDPAKPQQVGMPLATGTTGVTALAYSPDGRTLAFSGAKGIALWNVTEPEVPALITDELSVTSTTCRVRSSEFPCTGQPLDFTFTADGRNLLAAGVGGEILTWSLPPSMLTGHAGSMSTPHFDISGDRMTTQSSDGRITVWDLRNRNAPGRIGEYRVPPGLYSTELSPDGRTLLLVDPNRAAPLQFLDLSDPAHITVQAQWQVPGDQTQTFRFSPDWRTLATVDSKDRVQLWELTDRAHPRASGAPLTLESAAATDVYFGIDGKTLITEQQTGGPTKLDMVVTRWDITDPDHPRSQGDPLRIAGDQFLRGVQFSPDQRTMITITQQTIRLWDISDPTRFTQLGDPIAAHSQMVSSLVFTTDGRTMATSSTDGSVQLWDFTDRAHPRHSGAPLIEPGTAPWILTFPPNGHHLVGVTDDGAIRLWDLNEQTAVDRVCTITGKYWTPELWQRYLPQLPYNPPCD